MNEAAAAHLRLAKQALHAARAALAQVGEHPKTHRGTHDLLWTHFVQEGHLSRPMGRLLSDARDMRTDADYDVFSRFDTAAASDLLDDARSFVEEAEALISRLEERQK